MLTTQKTMPRRPPLSIVYYTQIGEDVIEPYLDNRKGFMDTVLKPLQDKKETLYVLPNSRATAHAERRYPHKPVKVVDRGIRER
jgi:hypothetical protein